MAPPEDYPDLDPLPGRRREHCSLIQEERGAHDHTIARRSPLLDDASSASNFGGGVVAVVRLLE
jgi:hypothetical protein